MKRLVKVLMVDDHQLIVEGYKNILLETQNEEFKIIFEEANSCKTAYDKLQESLRTGNFFDLIFMDINLPEYTQKKIYSGEDLGLFAKMLSSETKLIFLTMHEDNYRLYNIVKNVNPEGLLIKSDVGSNELVKAFQEVLDGKISYSHTVNTFIRKQITNDIALDQLDRQIIYYLSKGIQTKKLPERVPLSLAAIEKRKRNLKDLFGLEKEGDLVLIEKAKSMGFV
ncbi:transcriptional regulator [Salegentibacter salinarum]|uniref:Transcriptional regulator n=1 Tax=Salegentibacter salinarum TaxID=447422 RepID=A0A2N0TVH9_9FLAO|nr:response regulator [Salegentibacter salinarum]PKD18740.1 transcriptional regulator [Salegentibacter salinarum]SKB98593.1 DNA-binding response regulator, NarL/FixJ family, contains REC and HTH domains [Salegentibacter salinarum]